MPEPRKAVMILVEASWEDQTGTLQTVPARMENKSAGGACIRIKTPIGVGSKLRIQSRWEGFSGVAKYCQSEGKEYLVGVQRDATKNPMLDRLVPTPVPGQEGGSGGHPAVSTADVQKMPARRESKPSEIPVAERKVESVPIVNLPNGTPTIPPREVGYEMDSRKLPISQPQDFDASRRTELQTKRPPKEKEAGKERNPMQRKWLELAPWHNKQNGPGGDGNGKSNGKGEKPNRGRQATPPGETATTDLAAEGVASFQVELLPMEDIFRMAGIMNPWKGYGIKKVVEMLHSEHTRGLSQEMKRAAVLMALDAAGISIDELRQDAKARQDALDSYEAAQRKQLEAEWERKAEENVQIQAELERVKAQYMARVNRNLDAVAREKTTFSGWLTLKHQESQSMSEAAELCFKSSSEPASVLLPAVSMVDASAKPV